MAVVAVTALAAADSTAAVSTAVAFAAADLVLVFIPGYYDGYYPYYEDEGGCYLVRQRVKTRHGWRIRRVEVCE